MVGNKQFLILFSWRKGPMKAKCLGPMKAMMRFRGVLWASPAPCPKPLLTSLSWKQPQWVGQSPLAVWLFASTYRVHVGDLYGTKGIWISTISL